MPVSHAPSGPRRSPGEAMAAVHVSWARSPASAGCVTRARASRETHSALCRTSSAEMLGGRLIYPHVAARGATVGENRRAAGRAASAAPGPVRSRVAMGDASSGRALAGRRRTGEPTSVPGPLAITARCASAALLARGLRVEQSLASSRALASAQRCAAESTRSQTYFRLGAEHAAFMVGASARSRPRRRCAAPVRRARMARTRRARRWPGPGRRGQAHDLGARMAALLLEQREEIATLFASGRDRVRAAERRWDPFHRDAPLMSTAARRTRSWCAWRRRPARTARCSRCRSRWTAPCSTRRSASPRGDRRARAAGGDHIGSGRMAPMCCACACGRRAGRSGRVFAGLVAVARQRASRGISVYPTGSADGEWFATYHLQNDLRQLRDQPRSSGRSPPAPRCPRISPSGRTPRVGATARSISRARLTASSAPPGSVLGSTLTAVQGPPGTGKTSSSSTCRTGAGRPGEGVRAGAPMSSGLRWWRARTTALSTK